MCDQYGVGDFVQKYTSEAKNPNATPGDRAKVPCDFPYMPSGEMECYLHSDIVLELPGGIERVQTVKNMYKFKIMEE